MMLEFTRKFVTVMLAAAIIILAGCSSESGINPSSPIQQARDHQSVESHALWGLYQLTCDPAADTVDVLPIRAADMHLNVLPFLEPPPLVYLTLESAPAFNGDILDVDIGLRHPFLGLDEFTGFDVCGIVISTGSYSGFTDSGITIAGPGDLYLVNADGHSRWWNPDEFPFNPSATAFGYVDGLLGSPNAVSGYNATLNGYKYFADGLDKDEMDITGIDKSDRGKFSAGQKNIRHYQIDMGDEGLIFNYAIDACWQAPGGDPPWSVPDDFAPEANRVEPWCIDVHETANSLWYYGGAGGGNISLEINIYDWYNCEMNTIRVESTGAFAMIESGPTGGNGEYSTFALDINGPTIESSDDLMILLTANTEDIGFQDFIPGTTTAAYKMYYATVSDEPSGPPPTAVADAIPTIGFINFDGDFYGNDSSGDIDLYEWDFDGDGTYDWSDNSTGDTTHAYDVEDDQYDATLRVSNTGGSTTDVVGIRMIDPEPIILNGNFWDGDFDDWTVAEGGIGNHITELVADPTFKHYVRAFRSNASADGGGTRFLQTWDADVSAYSHLYFNVFFKLISQSLSGDGYWGTYGGWGEFPFAWYLFYLNQNDEPRFVCYGYLMSPSDGQWEWDKSQFQTYHPGCAYYYHEANVTPSVWHECASIDLMSLGVDSPKTLQYMWIWPMGWDYESHFILPWFSDHTYD